MKGKKSALISIIFIVVMIVITYLPVAVLTVYSFTDSKTIGIWNGFTFDLYKDLFTNSEILEALKNTIIVGVTASLLAVILGTMASIGIHHLKKSTQSNNGKCKPNYYG